MCRTYTTTDRQLAIVLAATLNVKSPLGLLFKQRVMRQYAKFYFMVLCLTITCGNDVKQPT